MPAARAVTVPAWGWGLCSSALNCVLPIDNHVFATGDDGGGLKVWDLRKGDAVLEARQQEEYISAMAVDGNGKILLTARYWGLRGAIGLPRARAGPSRRAGGSILRHVPCSRHALSISRSGDGTLGVFNVKRRRFDLLSEPQNGDLTSVVLLKVGAGPCRGAGSCGSLSTLRVPCSASALLSSVLPREGRKWRAAPAKAPSTSSTGTASGPPATASL